VSTNGGATWSKITTTGFTIDGDFVGASCTGNGSSAICIAAGQDNTGTQPPLLVESTDGGNTWSEITTTGFTTNGLFVKTAATGSSGSPSFSSMLYHAKFGPKAALEKLIGLGEVDTNKKGQLCSRPY
jgi:hypothetical protein